jgi:hypothetical protein
MNVLPHRFQLTRVTLALAIVIVGLFLVESVKSSVVIYGSPATGTGAQYTYLPTNSMSGVMTSTVPRFNGPGTLVQADFEWAGSVTGTWVANGNPGGVSTLSISGPTDVGGQPMGNLSVGFVGPYDNVIGSNDFDAAFTNLTLTSGPFFNTLTGPGTVTMTWVYSGTTSLSTAAIGTGPRNEGFSWGGSVHVTYTYVPEPGSLLVAATGVFGLLLARRKR